MFYVLHIFSRFLSSSFCIIGSLTLFLAMAESSHMALDVDPNGVDNVRASSISSRASHHSMIPSRSGGSRSRSHSTLISSRQSFSRSRSRSRHSRGRSPSYDCYESRRHHSHSRQRTHCQCSRDRHRRHGRYQTLSFDSSQSHSHSSYHCLSKSHSPHHHRSPHRPWFPAMQESYLLEKLVTLLESKEPKDGSSLVVPVPMESLPLTSLPRSEVMPDTSKLSGSCNN